MSVTIGNQQENHRGVYFEATGDGATTALVVTHNRAFRPGTTFTGVCVVAPSTRITDRKSGCGGFIYPADGTNKAISSITNSGQTLTVTTNTAIANATKGYVVVVASSEACGN